MKPSKYFSTLMIIFVLFSLVAAGSSAAPLEIHIKNAVDSTPIAGALVAIPAIDAEHRTDSQGAVHFPDAPHGRFVLMVSHPEYLPLEEAIQLESPGITKLEIRLTPNPSVTEEITIMPGEITSGQRTFSPVSVEHLAGAAEDLFKVLQSSPGILAQSEADSRLYVRGSPPSENLVLIDNVAVYDPYRLFGLVTLFDPETVSEFTIWPGGFPARYGNRLSAVVEVSNRYGTTDEWFSGSINTSFTSTSLLAEGKLPLTDGTGSWMVTMRRTYYDLLLKAMDTGPSEFPHFFDVQARFFYQPSNRQELSFFSIFSEEGTDLSEDFEGEFSSVNVDFIDDQRSRILGMNHYFHLTPDLFLRTTLSEYSNDQASRGRFIAGEEAYTTEFLLDLRTEEIMLQENLEFALTPTQTIEGGILRAVNPATSIISFQSDDPAITIPPELLDFRSKSTNDKTAFYFQDFVQLRERFTAGAGVRYDRESLSGFERWSPRLNLTWNLDNFRTLRAATGIFYHFPSYESLQGDGLLFDLENLDQLDLKPERAVHYILGFEEHHPGIYRWSIEAYYKQLSDLIVGQTYSFDVLVLNEDGTSSPRTVETTGIVPVNDEKGYARGIEFLFQRENIGEWLTLQSSYSLAETRVKRRGESWHATSYDQRHTLNLTGEAKLSEKWVFNFVWKFGSGFPYTPPGEILTLVEDLNHDGDYDPREGERLSYLELNDPAKTSSRRFPVYHRLDARINYLVIRSSFTATFYLDVINLYAQKNIQSYEYNKDYSERKAVEGLPFLPTFGIHLLFNPPK